MKKLFRSSLAVVLVLTLVASCFVTMAADTGKKYHDYGSYVLLGDSVASGWSDIEHRESTFKRVEGSYGAHIADDLGVTYYPMACIGFRTNDLRYIFEDDYDYENDRFLFYSVTKEEVDSRIPAIRKAVSEAGLITLNVGGNDWGSYLGWHVVEAMEKVVTDNEEFFTAAREYLENNGTAIDTVNSLIDIAALAGCLPNLVQILPAALNEGLTNFFKNWNILVEDIYALNPDVTLVAIGLFDSSLQDETMDEINAGNEEFDFQVLLAKANFAQLIVDYANTPMREGAKEYGYIFVDPVGTKCEKQHPSYAGHRHIADLVLAALPDASFPYTDVDTKSADYKAIETMYNKQYMTGTTETTFAPDVALSKADLSSALNKIAGVADIAGTEGDVKRMDIAKAVWDTAFSSATSTMQRLKTMVYVLKLLINGGKFDFTADITRAQGASILYDYINL